MLRPSYSELMGILNGDHDLDSKITSRYTIVIAAAKRARQIVSGAACDETGVATDKAVSIAISELGRGLIKIYPEGLPKELENVIPAPKQDSDAADVADDIDDADAADEFDEAYEGNGFSDDFDEEE